MQIPKVMFSYTRFHVFVLMCLILLCIACTKPTHLSVFHSLQSGGLEEFPTGNHAVVADTIPNPIPPGPFSIVLFDTIPNPIPPSLQSFDVTSFVPGATFTVNGKTIEVMKAQNTMLETPLLFIKEIKPGEQYYILRVTQEQADVQTTRK